MAKLKIVRTDGTATEHEITPAIEYAFEQYRGKGFYKTFEEEDKRSDLYWVAYECIRKTGEVVKPFGAEFLETLKSVVVVLDDPLA